MKFEHNSKYTSISIYAFLTVLACILTFFFIVNLGGIAEYLLKIIDILLPFVFAFVIAYLLNPIMIWIENRIFKRIPTKKERPKLLRAMSLIITYLIAVAFLTIFIGSVVPQIAASLVSLGDKISQAIGAADVIASRMYQTLHQFNLSDNQIQRITDSVSQMISSLLGMLDQAIPYVINMTKTITIGLKNVILGIIISVYMLLSKEKFFAQLKKVMYALLPNHYVNRTITLARSSHKTFAGFINGKIIDSFIIGVLCFIGMSIFKMPYAALISVTVGITNVIPYFGPFIGAIPSALILLIDNPMTAFWFCIFILALQQFDGNILGPKILGETTGLTSFWVIFSIIISGGLFGVVGMFIGVPTFAVIYALIRAAIEQKLSKKGLPQSTEAYDGQKLYEEDSLRQTDQETVTVEK